MSASRTRGCRATIAAAVSIAGVRIADATSWPSTRIRPSPTSNRARAASAATAASSDRSIRSLSAFHASARYMAPVSMWR
jgi:hypothetical protein